MSQTALKIRVVPRYPAKVSATDGLTAVRSGIDLVIKSDYGDLVQVPTVTNPDRTFMLAWDADIDNYQSVSFTNIINNIQDAVIGPPLAAIDAVNPGADQVIYFTVPGVAATFTASEYVRGVSNAVDQPSYLLAIGAAANTALQPIATRAAMAALVTPTFKNVYLNETDREGEFAWTSANVSAFVSTDPTQALYVPPASDPTGASGAWVRKYSGTFLARWCGSNQAAIEAAHALADEIRLDRTFNITSTSTWPNGKIYRFANGAGLVVSTGVTLTIKGTIDAGAMRGIPGVGPNKIFNCLGTGKVIGIARTCGEWWGAVGDYTSADDQPALQAAHDSVENSYGSDCLGRPTLLLRAGGQYGIDSTLVLRPKHIVNLSVEGGGSVLGTRIWVRSTFSGVIGILVDGQTDGSAAIADFHIKGFSLYKVSGASAIAGIQVGNSGKSLIGYKCSVFENIHVNGFTWNWNVTGLLTRLIKWDRCDGWSDTVSGSIGMRIKDGGTGSFVGDLIVDSCQFVVPVDSGSSVQVVSSTSGAQIKGLRFPNCTNYKGSEYFSIQASAGGIIGDIWLPPGVQFDGFGQTMLRINASGSGTTVDDIHAEGVYFRGVNSGYFPVNISGDGTAILKNLFIRGCWFANTAGLVINISKATAVTVCDNQLTDIDSAGNSGMYFTSCTRVRASGNILNRTGTQQLGYFITFDSCDYYTCDENIAGGIVATSVIREVSPGAHKYVGAGNI
ncbi:hypothetical protein [Rhizobium hainanense]|uniref:Uncharacterized protein n=1 Tax=Rhizobium hainanense TaxID=52131 RepID=A0A1C3UM49_9HYPH|nr:hypothetical protein [Rhizobium hainanense]SCB16542.1 hypothetical protein GA0061100_102627 [Rhizobium hainanense]